MRGKIAKKLRRFVERSESSLETTVTVEGSPPEYVTVMGRQFRTKRGVPYKLGGHRRAYQILKRTWKKFNQNQKRWYGSTL